MIATLRIVPVKAVAFVSMNARRSSRAGPPFYPGIVVRPAPCPVGSPPPWGKPASCAQGSTTATTACSRRAPAGDHDGRQDERGRQQRPADPEERAWTATPSCPSASWRRCERSTCSRRCRSRRSRRSRRDRGHDGERLQRQRHCCRGEDEEPTARREVLDGVVAHRVVERDLLARGDRPTGDEVESPYAALRSAGRPFQPVTCRTWRAPAGPQPRPALAGPHQQPSGLPESSPLRSGELLGHRPAVAGEDLDRERAPDLRALAHDVVVLQRGDPATLDLRCAGVSSCRAWPSRSSG